MFNIKQRRISSILNENEELLRAFKIIILQLKIKKLQENVECILKFVCVF